MPLTTITVNNKNYQLICDPGKEEELKVIAQKLNELIITLKASNKSASSEMLLLMAALSLQSGLLKSYNTTELPSSNQVNEVISSMINYLEELEEKFNK